MKKPLLILFAALAFATAQAQDSLNKLQISFAAGPSLLGSGDMTALMFDHEISYRLNRRLAIGGGMGYGNSDNGVFLQASFMQVNANAYLSPFGNDGRNDFRIGAGLTWYRVSDSYISSATYVNGQLVDADYAFDTRNSAGFSIILEDNMMLGKHFFMGLRAFTQPYFNGDINSGVLLKGGWRI